MIRSFRRRCARPVLRVATAASLVALPLFGVPSLASAQAACLDAPLTAYLVSGFDCRIGAWSFNGFEYSSFVEAEQGLFAQASAADAVFIHPFSFLDSLGRQAFGFSFEGLGSSVSVAGGSFGGAEALAQADLFFSARALDPNAGLLETSVELSAFMAGTPPATRFLVSSAVGMVGDIFGSSPCVTGIAETFDGPGTTHITETHDCFGEFPLVADVLAGNISFMSDSPVGTDPFFGTTSGAVHSVTFVTANTVPEPGTALLVAPALLAFAAAGARRARVRKERAP